MTDPEPGGPPVRTDPDPAPVPPGVETPGTRQVKKTERPHPLTPFIRGWLILVALLLGLARQLVDNLAVNEDFDGTELRWILPFGGGIVLLAAVVGFVSWYFTRFVIDDEELRIETGVIFKRSKKVPFERLQSVDIIQPFAARLFGLAELRLEAGAGGNGIKLRYLSRAEASRLRDFLLTRAHGRRTPIADVRREDPASRFTDLGSADRPLVRVLPPRLILGFVASSEFLITAAISVAVLIVTLVGMPFALTGLIPLVISVISLIGSRVVAMFNFTLAESARGLRVTRGLTNLTSQSVPVNRIQGIKISQSLLWRPLGWYRVDIDILGYAGGDGENENETSSVLLPVATADEVRIALDRVLPGVDLDAVPLIRAPRRAAWVRCYDFWTLRSGMDEHVLVTENGWLTWVRNVVPHAKTQSVRLTQGPLQRRLRLADVHIDTPHGPVNATAHQLQDTAARALVVSQLDRARAARAADRARSALPDDEAGEHEILQHFQLGPENLIGSGGEARVYALDEARVLRIYRSEHESTIQVIGQLQGLYRSWQDAPIAVPVVLENGERAGRVYTVNRRLGGQSFDRWLAAADPADRPAALLSYLDAAQAVQSLPAPLPGFARLVGAGAPESFGSLAALLNAQLQPQLLVSRARLDEDVPDVGRVWDQLLGELGRRDIRPAVVHGDFCPANTYLSPDPADRVRVTGVGDFSPHTLLADPAMDLAGAVIFLELESYGGAAADARWLEDQAVRRWGRDLAHWIAVYRRFYGFYFSSAHVFDEALYQWCRRQLTPLA